MAAPDSNATEEESAETSADPAETDAQAESTGDASATDDAPKEDASPGKDDAAKKDDAPAKDDAKKDAAPKKDEKKKPSAAKAALAKSKKKKTRRIGEADEEEKEKTAQDIFVENLPTIVVVALIFMAIPVLYTRSTQSEQERGSNAWAALAEHKKKVAKGDEGFEELLRKHKNTDAAPFIRVSWASRLYESGEKAKVEQCLEIYKDVLKKEKENPFLQRILPDRIKKIEAELKNPKTPWPDPKKKKPLVPKRPPVSWTPPKKTAAPKPPKKTAAPKPPPGKTVAPPAPKKTAATGHEGHDHGPGEGHGH